MVRRVLLDYRVVLLTAMVVVVLVVIRELLWAARVEGLAVSSLASSIVGGGILVMGVVVAGTLSEYKDGERAEEIGEPLVDVEEQATDAVRAADDATELLARRR